MERVLLSILGTVVNPDMEKRLPERAGTPSQSLLELLLKRPPTCGGTINSRSSGGQAIRAMVWLVHGPMLDGDGRESGRLWRQNIGSGMRRRLNMHSYMIFKSWLKDEG